MAFKEKVGLDSDTTTAIGGKNRTTGKANPKSVEGYYLGTKEVESKKSKSGTAKLHILQTSSGNLGVWGKTDMDRKMVGVAPGVAIRITHTGMQATPNGEMYKYKVEVDEDNTIDVGGLASSVDSDEATDEDTGTYSAGADEEEAAIDEDYEEVEAAAPVRATKPKQAASAPSSEAQRKAQELLSRRRTA